MKNKIAALLTLALLLVGTTVSHADPFTAPSTAFHNGETWTWNIGAVTPGSFNIDLTVDLYGTWGPKLRQGLFYKTILNGADPGKWTQFSTSEVFVPTGKTDSTVYLTIPVKIDAPGLFSLMMQSSGKYKEDTWQPTAGKAPLPAAVALLGSGFLGLFGINRFRKHQSNT